MRLMKVGSRSLNSINYVAVIASLQEAAPRLRNPAGNRFSCRLWFVDSGSQRPSPTSLAFSDCTMEAFLDLLKDVWDFLKVRKKYWLAPLIITIVLMGSLLVFTQGSVVAPFIYSIF